MPPREEHQNLEENYQPARTPRNELVAQIQVQLDINRQEIRAREREQARLLRDLREMDNRIRIEMMNLRARVLEENRDV
ncbi:Cytosolic protein [Caenorhabditis elegans]|uniref:Cytosolic protein n=1 Tax=Caenorhabditis elegans TaxID=6239 RepID=A0A7R9SUK4_CAEEL|nr:Cytosolic protein [Caenorhabditis elegans]CAD8118671.1 Cytosolic protein [Caenorhabditis elegans]